MLKTTALILSFLLPVTLLSQQTSSSNEKNSQSKEVELTFEEFCKKEALNYINVPEEKLSGITFSGELPSLVGNSSANFMDYKIELKENETQYFKLIGSDKILVAKSLFVLRVNYNNLKK